MYRELILPAAERVFAERGYEGTRMQHIAAEAGLALGTVYRATEGKAEIFAAIHRLRGDELLTRAAAAAQGATSTLDALLRGVKAYVEFLVEHPHYLRIHLTEGQPWALSPRFSSAEQQRQWSEGLALSVAVFRAGIAEGVLVDDEPERLARLMIAAHQVLLVDWVESGMTAPPPVLIERMQAHVRRAFVR